MKVFVCLFSSALLAWCGAAKAQANTYPGNTSDSHLSVSTLSGGINLRSVEGAPFSADLVKESVQLMPDGTSARHETRGRMFRDSQGRTRSETELESAAAGGASRRFVTIIDPVQQLSFVLDVEAKKAMLFHLPAAPTVSARQMKLAAAAQSVGRGGIARSAAAGAEELGAMTVEGFSVTGSRRTHPLEAGVAKDKTQVTESWFSPELKVELLATTQVSPSLTRTTRLTNIVPGEPDPALFQVPPGYTVEDNSVQK